MKIRSVTCFAPARADRPLPLSTAGRFLVAARNAFTEAGYEVQTVRAALPPLARLLADGAGPVQAMALAQAVEQEGTEAGIDYLALGPVRSQDPDSWVEALPELLDATERLFATVEMADPRRGIDPAMVAAAAKTIVANAPLRPDGFVNLRFAALANVGPGVPFLPAAYQEGDGWSFAVATESADLARAAFAGDDSLDQGCARLIASIEEHAARLTAVARRLERESEPRFAGLDFSLAPFPRDEDSIGATLESMGIGGVGRPGSVVAAAVLTSCLDRARFVRAGFSGLFLPVLEDDRLAARAAEGNLRLEDLLLAATVCGTGLDTVPLPGDVRPEELEPWLFDLCALALRHAKPLTARLMPMPGKAAGDALEFDFPFFASGRVMDLRRGSIAGALRAAPAIALHPHRGIERS